MGTQNTRFATIQPMSALEQTRIAKQLKIDSTKSVDERRKLGQFSTPFSLASEVTKYGLSLLEYQANIRFLEPAIGTGSFFSALLGLVDSNAISSALGFEIDTSYSSVAKSLWGEKININICDFTKSKCLSKVNLLLSNPPYVRHHYISQQDKKRMSDEIFDLLGIKLSGLAGLYCYFILLSHKWLEAGAVSGWLIPSEFMDVNYGDGIKDYLLNKVRLVRIHRYNPENPLFNDALVSSCVVWFKNEQVDNDYEIEFSYGGSHDSPDSIMRIKKSNLKNENKWTRFPCKEQRTPQAESCCIGDYFTVSRGLATGDNNYFIMTKEQIAERGIDMKYFTPILPSPRYLKTSRIDSTSDGNPVIFPQYFLLNCNMPESEAKKDISLWSYLLKGKERVAQRYLCKSRKIWYSQEHRDPAPILCTYMGRNTTNKAPFRFILNNSKAVVTNSYLILYPKKIVSDALRKRPSLILDIWNCLNSISADDLEGEGRVYGGGLKKIEPKELEKVRCNELRNLLEMG